MLLDSNRGNGSVTREHKFTKSQLRLRRAINSVPSNEAVYQLASGDDVLVYRGRKDGRDRTRSCTAMKDFE